MIDNGTLDLPAVASMAPLVAKGLDLPAAASMTPLAAKGLAPVLGIEPALVSVASLPAASASPSPLLLFAAPAALPVAPAALPVAPAALQVASTLIEQVASTLIEQVHLQTIFRGFSGLRFQFAVA